MKFTDGAWMRAKGVTPFAARRVFDHFRVGDDLHLRVVDRDRDSGIDRVEGTVLQVRLSSPMADTVRVSVRRHASPDRGATGFELDESLHADNVEITELAGGMLYRSGRLTVRVDFKPFAIQFQDSADGDGLVTDCPTGGLAAMQVEGRGNFMSQRLSLRPGEKIFGLGERFGPLAKNGQTVVCRNEDGGTVSDQAYKNIPFYLSSRGYGLLVNSPATVEFEIATERVSQVQFSLPGETLDYVLFYGPDPKKVLEQYTRLAGRPAVPPPWSFGLWLSTSFTTQYDEKTVNEFVDGMAERDIPLSVFHFDCFWMKERQWCDFEWDRRAFPDPEGMLRRLKARGLKVCVWINSYISQLSPLFEEGRAGGFFLKTKDGEVYQRTQWQPGMAFVDFTNPAAVEWFTGKLKRLLEMGVDSFKTDFAERIPDDAVYHDGSDPTLMHNLYAYLYNKAVFGLLEDHFGQGEALVFARSASGGSQKFPVHWGGDCDATFASMAEDLRGGLSFCMSGPAFWSHDIGGFAGTADAGLYKRWVAFGLLSTHSRLHGSESYRVPWLFDEESVEVMRQFTKLKNRLFPYLFAAARDANTHGWPVMRAMPLEFPDDPTCLHLEHQYLLGESLLVAPVIRPDNVAEYYLPAGTWTHLLSNDVVEGGRWMKQTLDYFQVPVYARQNTAIPFSTNTGRPVWRVEDELRLHVFHVTDGAEFTVRAAPSDGGKTATFVVKRQGRRLTITSDGQCPKVHLVLRSQAALGVENGRLAETAQGQSIEWHRPASPVVVTLAESGQPE